MRFYAQQCTCEKARERPLPLIGSLLPPVFLFSPQLWLFFKLVHKKKKKTHGRPLGAGAEDFFQENQKAITNESIVFYLFIIILDFILRKKLNIGFGIFFLILLFF